jgi:predicted MPP superfamily phosphohydrolase
MEIGVHVVDQGQVMRPFTWFSLAAYLLLLVLAARRRNRFIVIFLGVVLGIHTLSAIPLAARLSRSGPVVEALTWYAQAVTYLYFARFGRGRPGPVYRALVSWPASWFAASTYLAIPWSVAEALRLPLPWVFVPFAVAAFGFLQSITTRRELRSIVLDRADVGALRRYDRRIKALVHRVTHDDRPLRIVQITDPHLGPFMSEARLTRICERAVAQQPDLVLLTGDFLTVESQKSPDPLARSLAPFKALPGRVFACFGNHDHESPELVKQALASAGVQLLIDDALELELPWGPVQIVGADHHFRGRERALTQLAADHPRKPGHLRLWLLHDPGAFQAIPEGEADLVFSGHTHGGHLGLLSLGLPHTIVSAATKMPDHGVWARGRDRLYVHRGTGHYGFPLRIGVPAEESVLQVYRAEAGVAP